MIKTNPLKTFAFFGGCGTLVVTGYYVKLRMDTNEVARMKALVNVERLKFQRESIDLDIHKLTVVNQLQRESNHDCLTFQRESNNEDIRKLKVMNELKKEANHEEIRVHRLRIPWIIRWLM